MCAIASSTPSTTRAAMIASRYSVYQSSSLAARTRGSARCTVASPRTSQPASSRSRTMGARCVRDAGAVDEQRLGGAADAGAPHLGVERDGARHAHIGVAIDVHVAVAFQVADHRHARLALHALDQALAAARHDDVDVLAHAREHVADRGAVRGRHELDAVRGQAPPPSAPPPGTRAARDSSAALSEPPRRMAALPDFRHSAPASAVTLGRLS